MIVGIDQHAVSIESDPLIDGSFAFCLRFFKHRLVLAQIIGIDRLIDQIAEGIDAIAGDMDTVIPEPVRMTPRSFLPVNDVQIVVVLRKAFEALIEPGIIGTDRIDPEDLSSIHDLHQLFVSRFDIIAIGR